MTEKAEFAERLKQAMRNAGYELRPGVLAKEFNTRYWGKSVSFQAASSWLKGVSVPEQDKLVVLAEWLKVEPQLLRYGGGAVQRVNEARTRFEEAMNLQDREVFEAFLNLPAPQKKIVCEVILAFAKAQQADTPR
ncbi:MAG: transcriptional regulator [Uliginosibacterium sp.]|nr:transcriptional regulator [Uliginosibacterium sp.]